MPRFSFLAFVFGSLLIIATAFFYYPKWKNPQTEATISYDVAGYYLYLPAVFIYHDLKKLEFRHQILEKYKPSFSDNSTFPHAASGNSVIKYTCGQALQFLPWFSAGHLAAKTLGYPADGYSKPYQAALSWGSLLVALLGLWMLRRVLLEYFSEGATAATLLIFVFGTNYLNYSAIDGALTHNWLFTLYTLLIFSTIRFYRKPTFGWAAAIGLLLGWAILTRPTEIIAGLIPVFWGISSWVGLRERAVFFKNNFSKLLLAGVLAASVAGLQLVYWKYVSGEWLIYSYQEQGFSWLHPHLSDGLFSGRAGWLTYSPAMIFAVLGFVFLKKKQPGVFPTALAFCLIFMYLCWAWDIWWYGGSLGQRAMIQSYPVWAFPLAAFFSWVQNGRFRRWVVALLAGIFIYFNLWITHQAHRGGIFVSEQMTKKYLLHNLFRYEIDPEKIKLLDTKDFFTGEVTAAKPLYFNDFEKDTSLICQNGAIAGSKSLCLSQAQNWSPEYAVPLPPPAEKMRWIRASATVRVQPKEWEFWRMSQFIIRFYDGEKKIKERMIRVQRLVNQDETKTVFFDTKIPQQPFDRITVFFWNGDNNKNLMVDDLKVEAFR